MPKAQRTIIIDRPVDQVFAFFSEPSNDLKWRTHAKEIAADGPPRVGATIHQVIDGPGGRGIPADIRVTAYEPPSRYGFQVIGAPSVRSWLRSPRLDATQHRVVDDIAVAQADHRGALVGERARRGVVYCALSSSGA
jgi:uncharacterized protein YndB with AHSA1/START domain